MAEKYDLPRQLRRLEVHCRTILRAINEYEIEPHPRVRDQALHRIERSCLQMCEQIGCLPEDKRLYITVIDALKAEVARLTEANVRMLEESRA